MNINFKKTHMYIDFQWDSLYHPWFSYIGSKHYKIFMFYFFILEIDIYWAYRDWMIDDETIIDGKVHKSYKKNPEYEGERTRVIMLPGHNGRITFTY